MVCPPLAMVWPEEDTNTYTLTKEAVAKNPMALIASDRQFGVIVWVLTRSCVPQTPLTRHYSVTESIITLHFNWHRTQVLFFFSSLCSEPNSCFSSLTLSASTHLCSPVLSFYFLHNCLFCPLKLGAPSHRVVHLVSDQRELFSSRVSTHSSHLIGSVVMKRWWEVETEPWLWGRVAGGGAWQVGFFSQVSFYSKAWQRIHAFLKCTTKWHNTELTILQNHQELQTFQTLLSLETWQYCWNKTNNPHCLLLQ